MHRRAVGLTQQQLAEQAGYSVSYIGMLERGLLTPVAATVELLAVAFGLSPAESATLLQACDTAERSTRIAAPRVETRLLRLVGRAQSTPCVQERPCSYRTGQQA